jgi:hypothetical protein
MLPGQVLAYGFSAVAKRRKQIAVGASPRIDSPYLCKPRSGDSRARIAVAASRLGIVISYPSHGLRRGLSAVAASRLSDRVIRFHLFAAGALSRPREADLSRERER